MNEKKEKRDYYFTSVPSVLIRAYDLLSKNDRDLLIQIISYHPNSCFLTVDKLTEQILVCGEQAFYRSVYKLAHLKLIHFKRGNRSKPNHYMFEPDPQKWRLTKSLHEQLASDAKAIKDKDLTFANEPFPNVYGFIASFNLCYPDYKIEVPKKSEIQNPTPVVTDDISVNIQKWFNRMEQMARNTSTFYIIKNYNYFDEQVAAFKAWGKGELTEYSACEAEKRYIKLLVEKFDLISKNPKSEFEQNCFALMQKLLDDGKAGWQIEGELVKLKRQYDEEKAVQAPVQVDPETKPPLVD